ncbi:MAG: sensor histidine kinase [Bacteroidota bacterium]|jgi:K+-sensing histidine kinase KdpD|nr:HAMP domain-containing histidine kinase [Sphingobacteriales bacterium]
MRTYDQKIWWKRLLLLMAMGIGVFSLWYTRTLADDLAKQEEKKMLLWANALKELSSSQGQNAFALSIIMDNESIPVIVTDENGNIINDRNLDSTRRETDTAYLKNELALMKAQRDPIKVEYLLDENTREQLYHYVYYKNSYQLTRLRQYPYYQLTIIAVFILISYIAFSSSRRAEQNRVWVGMSKETAHQLGTPVSSLMGWINLIRETPKEQQEEILSELGKDVQRLELITERFSKIGSAPVLEAVNVSEVLQHCIDYLQSRSGRTVSFELDAQPEEIALLNKPLFEWVIENLCKNAIDAMEGSGKICIAVKHEKTQVLIDLKDTGKGIVKAKFKTVFKPGYTTKKRGWGLGLSLAKRIIEEYHKGKIFVKESETGKGTTFRIILRA